MKLFMNPAYVAAFLLFIAITFFENISFAKGNTIIWQGTVPVKKTFYVAKGKTLEIRPGTRVVFSKGCGLKVSGTLKVFGLKGKEVVFTSSSKRAPGSWGEIWIEGGGESVMENCIVENATWGMHIHDTKLNIIGCTFRNNEGGLRFRHGPLDIKQSRFTGNTIGIRSYLGIGNISESDIYDNEIGIFIREKGGGLTLTHNNLYQNKTYNIRVGDFNTEDVRAVDNWWGNVNPSETIFDAKIEPDIGFVLFEPFSKEKISWQ
jgi:hypothetical protein